MNLSGKGPITGDKKLATTRITSLNPNAAEFIPSSVKSASGSNVTAVVSSKLASSASASLGKAEVDRSQSCISSKSDEEAHQYWRHQLPDDIIPDFKNTGDDDSSGLSSLSLSSLSLTDGDEASQVRSLLGNGYARKDQHLLSPLHTNRESLGDEFRHPFSPYKDVLSSGNLHHLSREPWERQIRSNDQLLSSVREGAHYNKKSRHGFITSMIDERQYLKNAEANTLEFLASQFPGFTAAALAEVFFQNGCDFNMTIENLSQLEVNRGLHQNVNSKTFSDPVTEVMDFPALPMEDSQNSLPKFSDDNIERNASPYHSSEKNNLLMCNSGTPFPSRGAIHFASAVQPIPPEDTGVWKFENNGSANANIGSSRSSHILASSYQGPPARGMFGDRLRSHGSGRAAPIWPETGEAIGASMYSEMREEAGDHARLRNAYSEQVRHAYMTGNKALAKELSANVQLHNMQMRAAHEKAQDSVYRHRNLADIELESNGMRRMPEGTIDLHGLQVNEAMHVLKRELAVMRNVARSADQGLHVYICVGTAYHFQGYHAPSRLQIAVQRFLVEDEGLNYSEPQPGLLRVVIY